MDPAVRPNSLVESWPRLPTSCILAGGRQHLGRQHLGLLAAAAAAVPLHELHLGLDGRALDLPALPDRRLHVVKRRQSVAVCIDDLPHGVGVQDRLAVQPVRDAVPGVARGVRLPDREQVRALEAAEDAERHVRKLVRLVPLPDYGRPQGQEGHRDVLQPALPARGVGPVVGPAEVGDEGARGGVERPAHRADQQLGGRVRRHPEDPAQLAGQVPGPPGVVPPVVEERERGGAGLVPLDHAALPAAPRAAEEQQAGHRDQEGADEGHGYYAQLHDYPGPLLPPPHDRIRCARLGEPRGGQLPDRGDHGYHHEGVDGNDDTNRAQLRQVVERAGVQVRQGVRAHVGAEEEVAEGREQGEDDGEAGEGDRQHLRKVGGGSDLQLLVHGQDAHLYDNALRQVRDHGDAPGAEAEYARVPRQPLLGRVGAELEEQQGDEVDVHDGRQDRRFGQVALADEAQRQHQERRQENHRKPESEERATHEGVRGVVDDDDVAREAPQEHDPDHEVAEGLQEPPEAAWQQPQQAPEIEDLMPIGGEDQHHDGARVHGHHGSGHDDARQN
mmetsp:Transcript_96240/g.272473  ORF Transcript_96240/g.272473 Transcript_96240/m.272473 type:complete len:558 (-) Transcript_96240:163-1836(-)